jgi:hypothetical protein
MPLIARRTPAMERAASYGYGDFLKDIVQRTVADTSRGFKRPLNFSDEEIMQMAFAGLGGGTKIAGGLGKGKFPFNLKTTDVPLWDDVLKKPAYYKKAKGVSRNIEFMSKDEYFAKLLEGRGSDYESEMRMVEGAIAREYSKKMAKGAKFPMPGLEYGEGSFGQEGRHRMLAAEMLGIDRVPVLMIRTAREAAKKKSQEMFITKPHLTSTVPKEASKIIEKYKSQGLTYDAYVNQIPDRPDFAYHQWTFRGEGPLARATVTTKGTSLDEFETMVANKIRDFAKPMITAND